MSCHSTPANVAILGFFAQTNKLSMRAVETEFHWLKKIGRDRTAMAPTSEEWSDFLIQRERWVRHDASLSPKKRESVLARLSESYSQVPDGPTFYALNNLPVRLKQVTGPLAVIDAVDKVEARVERLQGGAMGKSSMAGISEMAAALRTSASELGISTEIEPGREGAEEVRLIVEKIRSYDLEKVEPAKIYAAHERLMTGLRARKK